MSPFPPLVFPLIRQDMAGDATAGRKTQRFLKQSIYEEFPLHTGTVVLRGGTVCRGRMFFILCYLAGFQHVFPDCRKKKFVMPCLEMTPCLRQSLCNPFTAPTDIPKWRTQPQSPTSHSSASVALQSYCRPLRMPLPLLFLICPYYGTGHKLCTGRSITFSRYLQSFSEIFTGDPYGRERVPPVSW